MRTLPTLCLTAALSGCGTVAYEHSAPKDWPLLTVNDNVVSGVEVIRRCSKYTNPLTWPPLACAEIHFDSLTCNIWRAYDATPEIIEHEQIHCRGGQHRGDTTLEDAWEAYKQAVAGRAIARQQ